MGCFRLSCWTWRHVTVNQSKCHRIGWFVCAGSEAGEREGGVAFLRPDTDWKQLCLGRVHLPCSDRKKRRWQLDAPLPSPSAPSRLQRGPARAKRLIRKLISCAGGEALPPGDRLLLLQLLSHEAKSLLLWQKTKTKQNKKTQKNKDTDKIIIITTPQLILCHGFTGGTKSEWPLSCCPCLLLSPSS